MKIASVKDSFHSLLSDTEKLHNENEKRPYLVVVSLKYHGKEQQFAIPLRKNIGPSTPKNQYYPLPPHPGTKPGHHHGLHFLKMFPVDNSHLIKYHYATGFANVVAKYISTHRQNILKAAQDYLKTQETEKHPLALDLDKAIQELNSILATTSTPGK